MSKSSYNDKENVDSLWIYYNHAMIPTTAPHEEPDLRIINDGSIWKRKERPILARWTTNFDCDCETDWWYVIKDTEFDISALKAKRRYEIKKGAKNFYVKRIEASNYCNELYEVQINAFSAYPKKYRPTVDKNAFIDDIKNNWDKGNILVYGAFFLENNELCGYAYLQKKNGYWEFNVLKTNPAYEKFSVNAAIVNQILIDYNEEKAINSNLYICDGSRSISHETAFQDYLEKYFGFRKAFCVLNIRYNPKLKLIIKFLYHFRKILKKFDGVGLIHSINGIMKMEEIVRSQINK